MTALRSLSFAVASALAIPAVSHAQVTAIFSNLPAGGNNTVPGTGLVFNPGSAGTSAFDRPFLSPDGSRWIFGGVADGTADLDVIVVGGGTTGVSASTVAIEAQATVFDPTVNWETIRTRMGINNAGQYTFSANVSGATTADDVVVLFNGVTQVAVAREGSPSPVVGQSYGTVNDSAHILNNGTVRHRSTLTPTTTRNIISTSGTLLVDTGAAFVPGNQQVAPDQALSTITAERVASSADGSSHIYRGVLAGPTTTNDVMIVNGNVVFHEGAPLPGGVLPGVNVGVINGDAGSQQISPNGSHWIARTALSDLRDVVVHNGNVVAITDGPIFPGSPLLWDDTAFATNFFVNTTNNLGDRVIGGLVNTGDANADAFHVFLGAGGNNFVFLRENDPVDLNGNGLFDDNAFIDTFGNDDSVLTDNGLYYFMATLRDGAGTDIGHAFLVVPVAVPEPFTVSLLGVAAAGGVYWYWRRRNTLSKALEAKLRLR